MESNPSKGTVAFNRVPIRVRSPAFGFAGATMPLDPTTGPIIVRTRVHQSIGALISIVIRNPETGELIQTSCRVADVVADDRDDFVALELALIDPTELILDQLRRTVLAASDSAAAEARAEAESDAVAKEAAKKSIAAAEAARRAKARAERAALEAAAAQDTAETARKRAEEAAVRASHEDEEHPEVEIELPEHYTAIGNEDRKPEFDLDEPVESPAGVPVDLLQPVDLVEPMSEIQTLELDDSPSSGGDRVETLPRKPYTDLIRDGVTLHVDTNLLGPTTGVLAYDTPAGGLFIETQDYLEPGSVVLVVLPGATPGEDVRTACKVVHHVYDARNELLGTDLAFPGTDAALAARLLAIVDAARAPQELTWEPSGGLDTSTPDTESEAEMMEQVHGFLARSVIEERGGRPAQAIDMMLKALGIGPPNPAEIHLRIAHLALDHLGSIELARYHVREAERREPEREDTRRLLQQIAARVGRSPARRRRITKKIEFAARFQGPDLGTVLGLLLGLAVAAAVAGWITIRHVLPRGAPPVTVSVSEIDDLVPATTTYLYSKRLYVEVDDGWLSLSEDDRRAAMINLAQRASDRFEVSTVLVLNTAGRLVASYLRDEVTVAP